MFDGSGQIVAKSWWDALEHEPLHVDESNPCGIE